MKDTEQKRTFFEFQDTAIAKSGPYSFYDIELTLDQIRALYLLGFSLFAGRNIVSNNDKYYQFTA